MIHADLPAERGCRERRAIPAFAPALLLFTLLAMALPAQAFAAGPIYALLVGIDTYQGAAPAGAPAGKDQLTNLTGAAADLKRMRALLVGEGRPIPDPGRVIVLDDAKATREAIGAALNSLIVRAAQDRGATVVFYFSGHGARMEDSVGDQPDWVESTIVPYDGRPRDQAMRDIPGRELRRIIEKANAWGVSVVTIFDSCYSGTATRGIGDAVSRQASDYAPPADPAAMPPPLPIPVLPPGVVAHGPEGIHVHLAAAGHGEEATERTGPPDNVVRGDFTAALADAVTGLPDGSPYLDIMRRVRDSLTVAGVSQHPYADGHLEASFLGHDAAKTTLYQAVRGGAGRTDCPTRGVYCVAGGVLSGVTAGSTFDVYASAKDGLAGVGAVAKGEIGPDAGPSLAHLKLAPAPAADLPREAWLRETRHAFGAETVRIYVDGDAAARARVATLIKDMDYIQLASQAQAQLMLQIGPTGARILTVRGAPLLDRMTDEALQARLQSIAKYYALLNLPASGARLDKIKMVAVPACPGQTVDCAPPLKFEGVGHTGPKGTSVEGLEYAVPAGTRFNVRIINTDDVEARYVYVLHLGSNFGVELIYPAAVHGDALLSPDKSAAIWLPEGTCPSIPPFHSESDAERQARDDMEYDRLLLIATDRPIDVSDLAFEGGTRGPPPLDPLEQLFRAAATGRRGVELVDVGTWGATILTLHVTPSPVVCPKE